nr:hypothetical protein [Tanacetum cinerariifolium]
MQTQEGMLNEGISLDTGLDSQASTYDNTSTEQKDESGSSGYVADAKRVQVDKDNINREIQGLGFENQNDVDNSFIVNKAKDLTLSLYNIDEMGKDLLSDHKIISEEELKFNIKLKCKVAKLLEENEHLKAHIQEKMFATTTLKNELRKSKEDSVDTKFAKPSILEKPPL